MPESEQVVVLVTATSEEEARRVAELLVSSHRAACVNIIPGVNSVYWWQGKMESATEFMLVIKTRAFLLPELIKTVKELHSYQVPEIIALPILGGNPDYLKWIDEVTKDKP